MKQFKLAYHNLNSDLQNLIVDFTYSMKSVDLLNDVAVVSFVNCTQLPVPFLWKKILTSKNEQRVFDWKAFLKTKKNPYSLKTLVDLKAVRETVKLINWNILKSSTYLYCSVMQSYTKQSVLKQLTSWSSNTVSLIYQIQRFLTCCDPRTAFLRGKFRYDSVVFGNPNPLSIYVKSPANLY